MAKQRIKRKIKEILVEYGQMNTVALKDHINQQTRNGTTPGELTGVLSSNAEFQKVRQVKIHNCVGPSAGTYLVWIWGLRE